MVTSGPLLAGAALGAVEAWEFRRRAVFDCGKWDPQAGDRPALATYPLLLGEAAWHELAALAEELARETMQLEALVGCSATALRLLGFPRALRRALGAGAPSAAAFRVMRFDFHPTNEGWKVTEVNSDVPGGFIESAAIARLMAAHHAGTRLPGDPAAAVIAALLRSPASGPLGLVHATAYTDDRQTMMYLARACAEAGLATVLLSPANIRWERGRAFAATEWYAGELAALLRFFPAEWLPNLPRHAGWKHYFTGGATPAANPAWAVISQSKRLALAAAACGRWTGRWRELQPETREPRDVPAGELDEWVLKPALGRVGESIALAGITPPKELRKLRRWARWFPSAWAAQRRFTATAVDSPDGPVFPCLGVYVIDGRAAGVYGRVASQALIDHQAKDVAVLIEPDATSPHHDTR